MVNCHFHVLISKKVKIQFNAKFLKIEKLIGKLIFGGILDLREV